MRKKSASGTNEFKVSGRQILHRKDGLPHYALSYPGDNENKDKEHLLRPTNISTILPCKINVINVQVQSEDTLQALALRYHCTISELKRINNILKDNEIHAHCTIKVPLKPYSLLTETIEQNNLENQNNHHCKTDNKFIEDTDSIVIPKSIISSTIQMNNIILNSAIEPLAEYHNNALETDDETETARLIDPFYKNNINSKNYIVNSYKYSGADWGLSWFQLIFFFLLVSFAGPILYILYVTESSQKND